MAFPPFYEIRQALSAPALDDVERSVLEALRGSALSAKIPQGGDIAITAGSRGIANVPVIIGAIVAYVRECGGEPFIVPAMGSHGGATAEGQVATLADLGITEESVEAPIRSSMETVVVGETPSGVEVRMDRIAAEADGIVAMSRIKPHTDYSGPVESGLCKMLAIGLGNHEGATLVHSYGPKGMREMVPDSARVIIENSRVLLGLAVIENSAAQTAYVEAVEPTDFAKRDNELLPRAKDWAPKLPFDELDILIIRWMGKDLSGTGIDTKVVGRLMDWREPDPPTPNIGTIGVLGLTPGSHGNAVGIGMADLTTQRLVDSISREATQTNAITARSISRAKIPTTVASDRELLEVALGQATPPQQEAPRIAIIQDTLHLQTLHISEALLAEAEGNENVTVERGPMELILGPDGSLSEFPS
ncbi:MAG: lactate racemase domain-containing protein [Armatimonadota bacterium]